MKHEWFENNMRKCEMNFIYWISNSKCYYESDRHSLDAAIMRGRWWGWRWVLACCIVWKRIPFFFLFDPFEFTSIDTKFICEMKIIDWRTNRQQINRTSSSPFTILYLHSLQAFSFALQIEWQKVNSIHEIINANKHKVSIVNMD